MKDFKNSDQYQIVWIIRRLFQSMGAYANAYLEDLGISSAERAVMEFLLDGSKLSVPEIASKYQVSRQHIQISVNNLLEKGLVTTEENPKHRRSHLIKLTPHGKRLFKKITRKDMAAIKLIFSNISDTDCKLSHKTLNKMLTNLNRGTSL